MLGKNPLPWWDIGFGFLHVCENPDQTWEELAPYICHEFNSYAQWTAQANGENFQPLDDESIRGLGIYPILTPGQALDYSDSYSQAGEAAGTAPKCDRIQARKRHAGIIQQ